MADRGEKHTFKIALQNEDVEVDVLVDVKPSQYYITRSPFKSPIHI